MLAFEETRHATAATVVIESSSFNEKEVLVAQKYCKLLILWCPKTQFHELIELRIDRANTICLIGSWTVTRNVQTRQVPTVFGSDNRSDTGTVHEYHLLVKQITS